MTPTAIIALVAALQNDAAQNEYTDAAVLPYFNMAMMQLRELFQVNNVPLTNDTSTAIQVDAGDTTISFGGSPALPSDMVALRTAWERVRDTNPYTRMTRVEYLPHDQEGTTRTFFGVYTYNDQQIEVLPASGDRDVKLDYVQTILANIAIGAVGTDLGIKNVDNYLTFETAALCSMFIGENETRALALETKANASAAVELGLSTKGRQSIITRRRPFRASFKRRQRI